MFSSLEGLEGIETNRVKDEFTNIHICTHIQPYLPIIIIDGN